MGQTATISSQTEAQSNEDIVTVVAPLQYKHSSMLHSSQRIRMVKYK